MSKLAISINFAMSDADEGGIVMLNSGIMITVYWASTTDHNWFNDADLQS